MMFTNQEDRYLQLIYQGGHMSGKRFFSFKGFLIFTMTCLVLAFMAGISARETLAQAEETPTDTPTFRLTFILPTDVPRSSPSSATTTTTTTMTATVATATVATPTVATPTELPCNPGFNSAGKVITYFTSGLSGTAFASALQPDGKLVIVGMKREIGANYYMVELIRLDRNGLPDSTFGNAGSVLSDFSSGSDVARDVAILPDGHILITASIAGSPAYILALYAQDGHLETSFGTNGVIPVDFGSDIAIQPDGKILLSGGQSNQIGLARYNPDGSLDGSFGNNGVVLTAMSTPPNDTATDLAVESDGKIALAGFTFNDFNTSFIALRYDSDGALDTSFGGTGIVQTAMSSWDEESFGVLVQADNKMILFGGIQTLSTTGFELVRYNLDGSLDSTFGNNGKVSTSFGNNLSTVAVSGTLQPDGKILLAGPVYWNNNDFAVARYNPDGSLDTTFGTGGLVRTDLYGSDILNGGINLQPDGKIVAVGSVNTSEGDSFAAVRYNSDGSLDIGSCPTPTPTITPTITMTPTPTSTVTKTRTLTRTRTSTQTASRTKTSTPTPTFTPEFTGTETYTSTESPTITLVDTPTITFPATDTDTSTPTETETLTATVTNTSTTMRTPSATPTSVPSRTPTRTSTTVPGVPVTISPTGKIHSFLPTYVWNAVNGASSYDLYVYLLESNRYVVTASYLSASSVCKNGICKYTPSTHLNAGNYQFKVRSRNFYGVSNFSPWKTFSISH
jgi:uncharacterized delta-60 repeat protein